MATDTTGEPMATPAPLPAEAVTAEQLARMFHETYERLAPSHGYETRKASAVPWDQVPEPNRSLMIAVAGEVLEAAAPQLTAAAEHDALCWEQTDDGRLIACDRKKDHGGGHSWEMAAAERERCAQLAKERGATWLEPCDADDQQHRLHTHHRRPFADLLREAGS